MKRKILFIEDDQDLVEMYTIKLIQKGYEIEIARNGVWGLKMAQKKKFNLIIMDISMPAMNGGEALVEIKKSSKNKDTPVIILSGSGQEDDIKLAKDNGADKYLLKSQVTPLELLKRVEVFFEG